MKNFTLLTVGLLIAKLGYGQQTEYSLHLTSGLSNFRGQAVSENAFIIIPDNESEAPYKYLYTTMNVPYTGNPFGKSLGLCYGAAAQIQRVAASKVVFGAQAGYEVLRGRIQISNVFDKHDFGIPVKGYTTLANSFINLHAFAGRRFNCHQLDVDLTAGPEIGWLQRSHETAQVAAENGKEYSTDLKRNQRSIDVRARLNLTAYYHRVGFSLGYSLGLSKYQQDYTGGPDELFAQVFRTGICYRLTGS